jgi:hypothetical protein
MGLAEQIALYIAGCAFVGTLLAHIVWAIIKGIINLFRR